MVGGKLSEREGQFYPPTIVTGVTTDMRIAQEEVFGPVMAISTFETDEEMIEMVNNCPYALGSYIFSGNAVSMVFSFTPNRVSLTLLIYQVFIWRVVRKAC